MSEAGEPATVEGVKGTWRVDPSYLGQPFTGRAALLSPFDRLIHDRKRTLELFEFDYLLEMYKPAASRRWGYFALPILYGDRLVGKLDATADRKAGVLRVHAVHEDVAFTKTMTAAVHRELRDLARWLQPGPLAAGPGLGELRGEMRDSDSDVGCPAGDVDTGGPDGRARAATSATGTGAGQATEHHLDHHR